jgi:hypothetical protein
MMSSLFVNAEYSFLRQVRLLLCFTDIVGIVAKDIIQSQGWYWNLDRNRPVSGDIAMPRQTTVA